MQTLAEIITLARLRPYPARVALAPAHGEALDVLLACDFITPVLIGDAKHIAAQARLRPATAPQSEIHHARDDSAAIQTALDLVRQDRADILMQGAVDNTLFHDLVLNAQSPVIGPGTTLSAVTILEFAAWSKLIMITDTLFNHNPTIKTSIVILQDALRIARGIGIRRPRVAVLAPLEYVNTAIPSTMQAAVLSKMGARAQFGNAVIDGPLDIDCALSTEAAKRKGVKSPVAGKVDIFMVADVESGFHLAQFLSLLGGMSMANVVMGTVVPVIPNLPCISKHGKTVEIALAVLKSGLKV